ncbi:MAG TPA: DUF222 domain-containing protein [Amycolatopsis sp.]|nr:DUF222 domain-containing protein [Amycolatopsis sp.]
MLDVFSLSAKDIDVLSDDEAVETMAAARRAACQADAIQARAIARLNQIRGHTRWVADEVALELSLTRQMAQARVELATSLTTRLPKLLAAMANGETDLFTAKKVHEVTAPLTDDQCRQVDQKIAGRIAGRDPGSVRAIARRATHDVDPEGYAERAKKRRKDRKVRLIHENDTMASLWAYLPAEIATAVYARIDTIARKLKNKDEQRTLDELRADVFADLLLGKLGGFARILPQIFIHVPLGAALNVSDEGCELAGHGTIPADIARDIMQNPASVWRKVTCDPVSGAVLDVGRSRYRPPAALNDFVRVRDRECRFPGCHRPAQRCEADHNRDYGRGKEGHTSHCNLCCLCQNHHHLKDVPGWTFTLDPDTGQLDITTPTDRSHHTRPEPVLRPRKS